MKEKRREYPHSSKRKSLGKGIVFQAHAFSLSRDDPTASSDVDQGMLLGISLAALDECGYGEARWLERAKAPQFPALPARTWPLTRGT